MRSWESTSDPVHFQVLCSLKRREPKKTLDYSRSVVAFVNAICFICSEKSLSLYFKSKVSFLCLQHIFSPYPVKESTPILCFFFPALQSYRVFHFAPWKVAQELLVNWQFIQFYNSHFSLPFMTWKSFLGGGDYFYSQSAWLCLN